MEHGAKLFLNAEGREGLFGDGKFMLLKAVDQLGSLRKAADSLGRGYKKAWSDIRKTEEGLGRKVLEMSRGGAGGGSARLTPFGRELIDAWEKYRKDISSRVDSAWEIYLRELIEGGEDGQGETGGADR